jgi:hypothetical protein
LSFLSSDTTASPADIIPNLRLKEQKLKGMHAGRWRVELPPSRDNNDEKRASEHGREAHITTEGPMVIIDGLLDVGSGSNAAGAHGVMPKYSFGMKLGLRSRPMGRCVPSYKSFSYI